MADGDDVDLSPPEASRPARPPGVDEARLREAYGPVEGWVRYRAPQFEDLQRRLDLLRAGTTVERYLRQTVRYAVLGGGAGAAVGLVVTVALAWARSLPGGAFSPLVGGVGVAAATLAGAGLAGGGHYLYPSYRVRRRRRELDAALPHAVVFLYALSHGGMNLYEVMRRLSESAAYGPVAAEFGLVVRDIERFDADLFTALERARDRSPSEDFEVFLDELVSVLETGGGVTAFLRSEAESHLERAEERQEELLEDLATLAEVYITGAFAGPIFALVVLIVASFVFPGVQTAMALLVYLGIPLGLALFGVVFDRLTRPYQLDVDFDRKRGHRRNPSSALPDPPEDPRVEEYLDARERSRLARVLEDPVATLRSDPETSFAFSVPIAALAVVALALAGHLSPTPTAMLARPIPTTAGLLVLPFLVAAVPYGVLDRLRRRRERTVRERVPAALEIVAEADDNGVPLGESFGLVARRMTGPLAEELARLDRDIEWTHDVEGALFGFAARIDVPAVTRVVVLLSECLHATSDLAPVFRTVADDLGKRNDLRARQRRNMRPYVVIVAIGVLVFLGIVAMFDTYFLPVAARLAAHPATALGKTPISVGAIPTETYRRLFFHAALIQAVGNGLLLGKLTDDRLRSGLLSAAALVVVVTLTFFLI